MSELFDEDPRDTETAECPPSRRSRALVITAIVLVVGFFGLTTFANFYTNVLWYRESASARSTAGCCGPRSACSRSSAC